MIFDQIEFNPNFHSYHLNGKRLQNVTSLVGEYQIPFDRDGISLRVAERDGRDQADVLAEWDAKGEAARVMGTRVHKYAERVIAGQLDDSDHFLALNEKLPEEQAFDLAWSNLRGLVDVHQVEWVIGDAELGIAGTVDAVLCDRLDETYHVWDWKTGKLDFDNRWQKLLPPFEELDDCKFHVYSLQVSLYRLILERGTDLAMGDSYLAWLRGDGGYEMHKAIDFTDTWRDLLIA